MRVFGRVQGVGFRYTVTYAAKRLGITGWVLNNWDGSVLLEAQGERDQLDRLLPMVGSGRFITIEDFESREIPVVEDERDFTIRG